ncbi:hypothetical protein ACP70R_042693 [Stipagrostis hirtigluma subsp. patula]
MPREPAGVASAPLRPYWAGPSLLIPVQATTNQSKGTCPARTNATRGAMVAPASRATVGEGGGGSDHDDEVGGGMRTAVGGTGTRSQPPSGYVDDVWTFNVYCDEASLGREYVRRTMDRDIICFFNLLDLAEKLGYRGLDYMYYKKRDGTTEGTSNLAPIESDSDVLEMVKQFEDLKQVSLCFMRKKASGSHISPVKFDNDLPRIEPFQVDGEVMPALGGASSGFCLVWMGPARSKH